MHQDLENLTVDLIKLSDEELVQRVVQDGAIEAYGVIYDRYSPVVFNKCLLFSESENAAADLMHDIFMKVYTSMSRYNNQTDFSTWLYSVTYKMCVNHVQKQHSNKKVTYTEVEEYNKERVKVFHCNAEEKLLSLDVGELKFVIKKLYPEDRVLLLMKYQDELTLEKIAEQLQLTVNTVEKRLYHAQERAVGVYELFLHRR